MILPLGYEDSTRRENPLYVVYLENDIVSGTDRHYTSGLKLSWFSRESDSWSDAGWVGDLGNWLPVVNRSGGLKSFGFALGQNIYTPQDIESAIPDPSDRPYAGWTYLEANFVRRTPSSVDTVSLQLGIVGRHSYAQNVQRTVHRRTDGSELLGWSHQLRDEPTVNLEFEHKNRFSWRLSENLLRFDFVPHIGGSIGNVDTYVNAGATGRLGYNLPNDFGVDLIGSGAGLGAIDGNDLRVRPRASMSLFVFGGVDGRAVARNIFLDGNTFTNSPSVVKETLVADVYWGVGLAAGRWQITFAYVKRTREFKGQNKPNEFGSLSLFCSF
jgi:lipid A 3-O-deacylase